MGDDGDRLHIRSEITRSAKAASLRCLFTSPRVIAAETKLHDAHVGSTVREGEIPAMGRKSTTESARFRGLWKSPHSIFFFPVIAPCFHILPYPQAAWHAETFSAGHPSFNTGDLQIVFSILSFMGRIPRRLNLHQWRNSE